MLENEEKGKNYWLELSIVCLSLFSLPLQAASGKRRPSMDPAGSDLGVGVAEAA